MWEIVGKYPGQAEEVVDTAEDKTTANYLLGEYRLAFGAGWTLRIRRTKPE